MTDHSTRAHALLSGSRIHRVSLCPGSLLAEEALPPEPSSAAAARGTSIHELSDHLFNGRPTPVNAPSDHVEVAVGYVETVMRETATAKRRYIELSVTEALQTIHPALGGTADLVAIGGGTLHLIDLKSGRIPVDPEWNPQLLTYALGAAIALKAPPTVNVRLAIYQPGNGPWREWWCGYPDLLDWRDKLLELATQATAPGAPLLPSADACRYCRAKPVCPALRGRVMDAAREEFAVDKKNVLASPAVTPQMLDDAELAMAWAESVQTVAKARLIENPGAIAGWKMRDGRKMVKWKDEKMAEALLADNRAAWSLKSASSVRKLGVTLPAGVIEESRAAALLVREK